MELESSLMTIIVILLIVVISSLPLHFAITLLGGRSSILKCFIVMIITALISLITNLLYPIWGTLIAWILLVWIFHEAFRLKWLKAILAWILWLIFIFIFSFIFSIVGLASFMILI